MKEKRNVKVYEGKACLKRKGEGNDKAISVRKITNGRRQGEKVIKKGRGE